MLDNLCAIGDKLYNNSDTMIKYHPFWAKVRFKGYDLKLKAIPPKVIVNIPVRYVNGLPVVDFAAYNLAADETIEYRSWNVLFNPNATKSALWLAGDITNLENIKDKAKLKKSDQLAATYFPNGIYDQVKQNVSFLERLVNGSDNYLIHFVYPQGKQWFEQESVKDGFNEFMREELITKKSDTCFVPVYNYLNCTVEASYQSPSFTTANFHKNISYSRVEDVVSYFWAQNFYKRRILSVNKKYDMHVMPDATGLSAEKLDSFYESTIHNNIKSTASQQQALFTRKRLRRMANKLAPLVDINATPDKDMQDIHFIVTMFISTSTFTKQEVYVLKNLTHSYLQHLVTSWDTLINACKQDELWTPTDMEYVIWGDKVWDKLNVEGKKPINIVTDTPCIQELFSHDRYQSLQPKLLYEILMNKFNFPELNSVFLDTIYEKVSKGGFSPTNLTSKQHIATNIKNSFLILTKLDMNHNPKTYNDVLGSKSFALGKALGSFFKTTAKSKLVANLNSRSYEIAGDITRHTGSVEDMQLVLNDVATRIARNKYDFGYITKGFKAINDAILDIAGEPYNADSVASGFFWEFLTPYSAPVEDAEKA